MTSSLLPSRPSHAKKGSRSTQACKAWLLEHVASSANRVSGLAKYLVALASLSGETAAVGTSTGASTAHKPGPGTSLKRRRLHILYLLNDLLHHSKYHLDTTATFSTLSGSLQSHAIELVGCAAAYDQQKHPRHHQRLHELLDIWSENGYFGPELMQKLRETVKNSATTGIVSGQASADVLIDEPDGAKRPAGKEAPYVMPPTHGDPSTPYYDLPAGNWIPHIIPNSTIPLRPDSIKPLQFLAGPADQSLVRVLKDFMSEVDQIYATEDLVKDDDHMDIDELGQRITRDEITGEILDGETYYGWSRAFCQQMKRRPGSPRSRSRSHSRSRGTVKRRYSESSLSDDSDRSRSHGGSRANDRDREYRRPRGSRSPSRPRRRSRSRTSENSYRPEEPFSSRFPPPGQPSFAPPPPPPPPVVHSKSYQPNQPYTQPPYQAPNSGVSFAPPPPPPYPGAWPPGLPPPRPGMSFPPLGPGMNHPAFPHSFPGQHHPVPMPPGQQPSQGQYHYPPYHPNGQHGGGWNQQGPGWQ